LNIFERKVYRRILGPEYDNEKENLRVLTNKEMYARVKNLLLGGSNMTGTDFCVNKPHCAAAVRP
jgi:hypothetical protein